MAKPADIFAFSWRQNDPLVITDEYEACTTVTPLTEEVAVQDYRKLLVWQKAHRLALAVYADSAAHLTAPRTWGLREQIHKAAISIPSNLAEGAGRGSGSDFRRFGFYSLGSTNELEYDFLLAKDLRFIPAALHDRRAEQIAEVRRMLSSFVQTLHSGR